MQDKNINKNTKDHWWKNRSPVKICGCLIKDFRHDRKEL